MFIYLWALPTNITYLVRTSTHYPGISRSDRPRAIFNHTSRSRAWELTKHYCWLSTQCLSPWGVHPLWLDTTTVLKGFLGTKRTRLPSLTSLSCYVEKHISKMDESVSLDMEGTSIRFGVPNRIIISEKYTQALLKSCFMSSSSGNNLYMFWNMY